MRTIVLFLSKIIIMNIIVLVINENVLNILLKFLQLVCNLRLYVRYFVYIIKGLQEQLSFFVSATTMRRQGLALHEWDRFDAGCKLRHS